MIFLIYLLAFLKFPFYSYLKNKDGEEETLKYRNLTFIYTIYT